MALITKREDRENGLIWLDNDAGQAPATHVLIAGIGRFDGNAAPAVSSPSVSARMVADWFLNGALARKAGFRHPSRPLASLALLLSEEKDGSESEFEGATVPRASFAALKAAVREWIKRARADPKNSMILFLASHGISAGRRTAILCEDYKKDPLNLEAGMTEVEQFVTALGQIDVEGKLLIFDCCRTEGETLDPTQTFGEKLIGAMAVDSLPRRPQVIRSTLLGERAYGKPNGPTLFTEALLRALGGLASDPNAGWQIGSSELSSVTGKLLGLYRGAGRPLQVPELELSQDFAVAFGEETDKVTLFVSVAPPYDEDDWKIEIRDEADNVRKIEPVSEGARHAVVELPALKRHRVSLIVDDANKFAMPERGYWPPVAFCKLPDENVHVTPRAKNGAARKPDEPATVSLESLGAGVARARRLANGGGLESLARSETEAIDPRDKAASFSPGRHRISVARNDGAEFEVDLDLEPGDDITIEVPEQRSPHEWMVEATLAGVIAPGTRPVAGNPVGLKDIRPVSGADAVSLARGGKAADPVPPATTLQVKPGPADGRFILFEIADGVGRRHPPSFQQGDPAESQPPWLLAEGPDWREIAFVPSLGKAGAWLEDGDGERDPWLTEILVDAQPPGDGAHLVPFVRNRQWGALLAFLGRRDFPNGAAALKALDDFILSNAVYEKITNPLAAIAGALTAVACGPIARFGIEERWIYNIAEWFPHLPDGAVVLGRHLLGQGMIDEAKEALETAAKRGVPVFSLAVDWLAEGLETMRLDRAEEVRRWSWMTDPERCFTILSLGSEN